jgi:hypothetical protein
MVPGAQLSIVPSNVCNATDHEAYRAVPSKTRIPWVEADSLPSLADAELWLDISHQTPLHSLQETVGHEQRGSVEKPKPTIGCPADES